ncbi:hypothetical protein CPB86DRAFT_719914, partial [Serendipita vermifera]
MKLDPPTRWDGSPDIDKLEEWYYHVMQYYTRLRVSQKTMVSTLSNFLEGKALRTFMSIVAPSVHKWTVDLVINLFFDELFPSNIREILRERFEKAEQEQLSVREWRQKVKDLAARVPDIDDAAKARRFWKGSKGYLRIKWAREGYNAEFDSFNDLYDAALRIEQ